MDKEFINIDDLFRQRLEGVEETEKSGAWLRMRDLLDQEMPRKKRIGIFYWRRLFTAVAGASLLATVCVGGYELSSLFRRGGASVANVSVSGSASHDGAITVGSSAAASHSDAIAAQLRTAIGDDSQSRAVAADRSVVQKSVKNRYIASGAAIPDANPTNAVVARSVNGELPTAAAKRSINHTNNHTSNTADDANASVASNNNNSTHSRQANNTANTAQNRGNNEQNTDNNWAKSEQKVSKNGKFLPNNMQNNASPAPLATGTPRSAASRAGSAVRTAAPTASVLGSVAPGAKNNIAQNNLAPTAPTHTSVEPATSPLTQELIEHLSINSDVRTHTAVPVVQSAHSAQVPFMSPSVLTPHIDADAATPVAKNNTATTATRPAATDKANPATTNRDAVATNTAKPYATGGAVKKNPAPEEAVTAKRVITKLTVHQRSIRIADNTYAFPLDTISTERISLDVDQKVPAGWEPTPEEPVKHGAKQAKTQHATGGQMSGNLSGSVSAKRHHAAADNAGGASNYNGAATDADATDMPSSATAHTPNAGSDAADPQAAPSESTATPAATKAEATTEKKAGVSMIKRLSAAFNEVKTNMSNPQFTGGVTAGINANFFGPASFKGFQFGVTGNVSFNETWNIMGELKYFHRLGGSASIQDNYYSYTQVASNLYRRDKQLSSYDFSALHTLEMPISVRYSMGRFNFYGGGNFLYAFSINTGAATMVDPYATPEYVTEVGNDNQPTLSERDFRSRFGLGYLLGFSYQLAPNASLDLRSVQTVWDNAATTGAKSISNQLYKTPSLQLSIMYRLGGNRSRE